MSAINYIVKKNEEELENSGDFRTVIIVIQPTCTQGITTENSTVPAAAPAVRKVRETCHVLEFRLSRNDLRHFGTCRKKNSRKSDGSGLVRKTETDSFPLPPGQHQFLQSCHRSLYPNSLEGPGQKETD